MTFDESVTRKSMQRAEYILNHYAKTDAVALARDLDRYDDETLKSEIVDKKGR